MLIEETPFESGDDEVGALTVEVAEKEVRTSVLFKHWHSTITLPASKPGPTEEQERFYLPSELAEQWKVSVETVRVLFRNEQGVLKIGKPGTKFRRPYYMLRIPESVVERVRNRLSE